MSARKGGGLLLVLGVPFALYAALQVGAAARPAAGASEPPADSGTPAEQLAAAHAKAAAWSGDVRKAVAATWRYRAGGADPSADPAARAVQTAAEARAADLTDLDTFLPRTQNPAFTGRLKAQYAGWTTARAAVEADEQAVKDWLARRPEVASAADAGKAMDAANTLIARYEARSWLANRGDAAAWRVQARLAVIGALTAVADARYRAAVGMPLPLKPENTATAKAALGALSEQVAALRADLKQADEYAASLDKGTRAAAGATGAVASEYAARAALLDLFAQPDLFTRAGGAEEWLRQVANRHQGTKDPKVHALIARKVQEFCEAFVPPAVLLDDRVKVNGRDVPRAEVTVSFEEKAGAGIVTKSLSDDATEFNEIVLDRNPPGTNHVVKYGGNTFALTDLKPTALSNAAVEFNAARKRLADATTAPTWTAKSVRELEKQCGDNAKLVDQLKAPAGAAAGSEPKIATRLSGLAAGLAAWEKSLGGPP